jgi:hypothetical protein
MKSSSNIVLAAVAMIISLVAVGISILQTANAEKPAPDSKIIFHNHFNTNEGNGNDKDNCNAQLVSPHSSTREDRSIKVC